MEKRSRISLLGLCVFSVLAVSCHYGGRPDPFLDKDEMCQLLTEIRLTEARLYNHRETDAAVYTQVMTERAKDVYVPIFQKYGINYEQYQALMRYYMAHPEKLEAIYEESARNLKALLDEKRAADSIAKAS